VAREPARFALEPDELAELGLLDLRLLAARGGDDDLAALPEGVADLLARRGVRRDLLPDDVARALERLGDRAHALLGRDEGAGERLGRARLARVEEPLGEGQEAALDRLRGACLPRGLVGGV